VILFIDCHKVPSFPITLLLTFNIGGNNYKPSDTNCESSDTSAPVYN
jgi:hypothetical protein